MYKHSFGVALYPPPEGSGFTATDDNKFLRIGMNNFQYYNPMRMVFGEGQIKELANLVPDNARVLITFCD